MKMNFSRTIRHLICETGFKDAAALVNGQLTIQCVNAGGHTVLFRRYNRDDWKLSTYQTLHQQLCLARLVP